MEMVTVAAVAAMGEKTGHRKSRNGLFFNRIKIAEHAMISSNSLRQMSSGGDLPAGSDEHSQYAGLQFSNLVTQGAGGEGSFPLPLDFPGTKFDESVIVPVLSPARSACFASLGGVGWRVGREGVRAQWARRPHTRVFLKGCVLPTHDNTLATRSSRQSLHSTHRTAPRSLIPANLYLLQIWTARSRSLRTISG